MKKAKRLSRIAIYLFSFFIVLIGQNIVFAQSNYPAPKDKYVNDYAQVLEAEAAKELRSQLKALNIKQGIEGTVLTIHSIDDYDTGDNSLESFATNLFNTWGIGNRERNDGFLILMAADDRRVRIEVGKGYGNRLDRELQKIINQTMIPAFRSEDYSRGVYEGTLSTIDVVVKARGSRSESTGQSWSIWTVVGVLVAVVVMFGGLAGLIFYDSSRYLAKSRNHWFRKYKTKKRRGNGSSGSGGRGSRGGSFGGGGSSGGGASGGW